MVDIGEHIAYWRDGAKDDWDAAKQLIDGSKTRQAMFFAHLALENFLKLMSAKILVNLHRKFTILCACPK